MDALSEVAEESMCFLSLSKLLSEPIVSRRQVTRGRHRDRYGYVLLGRWLLAAGEGGAEARELVSKPTRGLLLADTIVYVD